MIAFLAFVIPLVLYLAFPSAKWNFDGVACAIALEQGNPVYFFHSNHLLYGFLGWIFWKGMHGLAAIRALPALQLFSTLLACTGLVGLYKTLAVVHKDEKQALLITLICSTFAVFWVWSLEAQVYPLGFVGLAWGMYWLLKPEDSPQKWTWTGLFHGLAVLGHVLHLLWIIPVLYFWKQKSNSRQALITYLRCLAGTILIPYYLVIRIVIWPYKPEAKWFVRWLWGSAALSPDKTFAWHWPGWSGPWGWTKTSFCFFWGSFWPYGGGPAHTTPWILTVLAIACVGTIFVRSARKRSDPLWGFALLWIACSAVFFWTWEPLTECYRMSEILPVALLLSLGLRSWDRRWMSWTLMAFLLTTNLSINLKCLILPMKKTEKNSVFQEVSEVSKIAPANALVLTGGGSLWIYFLYFAGREAWNISSAAVPPEILKQRLLSYKGQRSIYMPVALADTPAAQSWLQEFSRHPAGKDYSWLELN